MHILYIHQYFATPAGRTGTRSYEFARRWVHTGHRVTLLTSTAQMTKTDLEPARGHFVKRMTISGIDVIAIDIPYRQSMGMFQRILAFFAFMIVASWFALVIPKVDVVYASSTPLTIGIPALLARWLRGRRFVFEVRDPWPAVPIALGVLKNRVLIAAARWLERIVYRNAEEIVALSEGMASLVRAQSPPSRRIETIPNCADTELFRPEIDGSRVRKNWHWKDRVVCVHAGAMGRVNGLDVIVRAAQHFRDDRELHFVFVGDGGERERLENECHTKGLSNVQFVAAVAKRDLPAVLAAVDVCLMTVASLPILQHNSANKLFDYLSAGKPVVLNYGGWQREALEGAGAGLGCAMEDDDAFFASIAALKADVQLRTSMGNAARDLAVRRFSRDKLSAAALSVVTAAARQ